MGALFVLDAQLPGAVPEDGESLEWLANTELPPGRHAQADPGQSMHGRHEPVGLALPGAMAN